VLVAQIDPRSPAYRAGLERGDVIVSFNGQNVNEPTDLVRLIADAAVGSNASIVVVRDGRRVTLQVPVLQREG
jgi:serine protease Do